MLDIIFLTLAIVSFPALVLFLNLRINFADDEKEKLIAFDRAIWATELGFEYLGDESNLKPLLLMPDSKSQFSQVSKMDFGNLQAYLASLHQKSHYHAHLLELENDFEVAFQILDHQIENADLRPLGNYPNATQLTRIDFADIRVIIWSLEGNNDKIQHFIIQNKQRIEEFVETKHFTALMVKGSSVQLYHHGKLPGDKNDYTEATYRLRRLVELFS